MAGFSNLSNRMAQMRGEDDEDGPVNRRGFSGFNKSSTDWGGELSSGAKGAMPLMNSNNSTKKKYMFMTGDPNQGGTAVGTEYKWSQDE